MRTMGFAALALVLIGSAAAARTAEQAAYSSARKRGYTPAQTSCFVPVFVSYARLDRNGRWVVGSKSKAAQIYRHDLWSKCGVIR